MINNLFHHTCKNPQCRKKVKKVSKGWCPSCYRRASRNGHEGNVPKKLRSKSDFKGILDALCLSLKSDENLSTVSDFCRAHFLEPDSVVRVFDEYKIDYAECLRIKAIVIRV